MDFPASPTQAARRLGVRGHQRRSTLVASIKAGGAVFVESLNEAVILLALEIDPSVTRIKAQPFTLRMDLRETYSTRSDAIQAARLSRHPKGTAEPRDEVIYTPDFLVHFHSPTPLVIEAKAERAIAGMDDLIEQRKSVLHSLGYHYAVVSSKEVNSVGLHANLVHLRDTKKFQSTPSIDVYLEKLNNCIQHKGEHFPLGEIKGIVPDTCIYQGLITGLLACDLRSGL